MAYLAVDKDGEEYIYNDYPERDTTKWIAFGGYFQLPDGSIAKLIGRELTWSDEPVMIE